ncbi:hypothetical protein JTE90_006357 [Oedothorax gibbosus]|uniref:Uncharacterized protein n=1 Tax=Oedothorax gibbosus TaxID=931172 RepID=A0AAV6VVU7_9ARAC|nr:hypothetical protein JTE90_006357 [Oedothorax gibbosus]
MKKEKLTCTTLTLGNLKETIRKQGARASDCPSPRNTYKVPKGLSGGIPSCKLGLVPEVSFVQLFGAVFAACWDDFLTYPASILVWMESTNRGCVVWSLGDKRGWV